MSDSAHPDPVTSEHPEFALEALDLDLEGATDRLHEALEGLTTTPTDDGVTVRTTDGSLIAVLIERADGVDLRYRTEPAHETATLRARKLRRALVG